MNNSIFDYWSRSEAAEHFGISVPALKKRELAAEEAGNGLSNDFVRKSNTKFWHKDEWTRIQSAHIQKYIDEAVELGLVVSMETYSTQVTAERDRAYAEGFAAGAAKVADELPPSNPHELNELEDIQATGYTAGGFQPLSALGL